jgi:predicted Zn-dependent peptidase
MMFWGMTNPGSTNEQIQAALREEIERLKTETVSADELGKVKTRAKADLIRSLESNSGIARALAMNQGRFGDWREMFHAVDKIDRVTAEDIKRVANETFRTNNRTVGMIVNEQDAAAAAKNEG